MTLVPATFLLRISYPCHHRKEMPQDDNDDLLDLPESYRLEHFGPMDGRPSFADSARMIAQSSLASPGAKTVF